MAVYAILRTDRIGDLILSLPVAEAIKTAEPESHVCFVVSPATSDIAAACPFVDSVITYDENRPGLGEMMRLASRMRSLHVEAAIFLRPTLRTALAAVGAGVRLRAGTAYRYYGALFNRRAGVHRKFAEKHEIHYNLGIARTIVDVGSSQLRPRIRLDAASRAFAEGALADSGLEPGRFVIVHPGCGGSARNLPLDMYAAISDMIENEFGTTVLITAGADEAETVEGLTALRSRKPVIMMGFQRLLHLAAVIECSNLFISGSTGPMHIAAAVGTPTLSFFSPVRSCSPRRWGPLGTKSIVLVPPVAECPTCVGTRCEHYDCMGRIPIQDVRESLRLLLSG